MSGPKILTLDIETAPAKVYVWDIFKPFVSVDQIIEPSRVICMAAKWHHEKKVMFFSEWDDENWITDVHALLNEADVVVHYNGDNFDLPHLNREFGAAGLGPVSPFKSVDLYREVKKRERHLSHKLLYISKAKGLSGKADSGGFRTWINLASEDEAVRTKAQSHMKKYNMQDVRTTEELFDNMRPHIKLPHVSLFGESLDGGLTCPDGHTNFQKRGWRVNNTRRYQAYQCQDCGKWFSDNRSGGSVSTQ